ncbi:MULTISPECIES: peptidase [unclassified Nostoc]|uniref:peptidase n=1 Tax=unclassified Nostoc TaxID=2593658 RepID=UPI002AD4A23A|nr:MULTISPECIES: peptidase [unclassified Nostoc]MDZ8122690.1 peptidase [Nostoc sp. CmiVER01]MDZ8226813.1 peptidase [Nostoc sp. ChiVER01]
MKRSFRKYHRILGIMLSVPLVLTVLTGILTTFVREWSIGIGVPASFLLSIHTGEIFHLQGIYPILNGLGLLGLLVTGLNMSGLFGKKTRQNPNN